MPLSLMDPGSLIVLVFDSPVFPLVLLSLPGCWFAAGWVFSAWFGWSVWSVLLCLFVWCVGLVGCLRLWLVGLCWCWLVGAVVLFCVCVWVVGSAGFGGFCCVFGSAAALLSLLFLVCSCPFSNAPYHASLGSEL